MAKILIFTNRLVIGGPSTHLYLLVKELQKEHEVLIVGGSPHTGEEWDQNLLQSLQTKPILLDGFSRKLRFIIDLRVFFQLMKIIRAFEPDIVHTHTGKPGFIGRIAARLLGVKKIVHTYHGFLFENYFSGFLAYWYRYIEKILAAFTHKIIVLSQAQYDELLYKRKIGNPSKVAIIPLGIELDYDKEEFQQLRSKFRKNFNFKDNEIVVGIIGRLVSIKNIKLFIDAVSFLHNNNVKFKTCIIGDGNLKETLVKYAESKWINLCDMQHCIKDADMYFTSWIKPIKDVYPALDLVVSTSLSEGTPICLMEAQLAGIPVVSTDVGGVKDIILDQKTGIIVPSNDLAALTEALKTIIQDQQKLRELGTNAYHFAHQAFKVQTMVDKIKEVYFY